MRKSAFLKWQVKGVPLVKYVKIDHFSLRRIRNILSPPKIITILCRIPEKAPITELCVN